MNPIRNKETLFFFDKKKKKDAPYSPVFIHSIQQRAIGGGRNQGRNGTVLLTLLYEKSPGHSSKGNPDEIST